MSIFAHSHAWEAVAADSHPVPFSAGITAILWRCPCRDVRSEVIAGTWTLRQVRGEVLTPDEDDEP